MTEDEAIGWMDSRFDAGAMAKVHRFVAMVLDESSRQNLVSRTSLETIWTRHIVDSAQLLALAPVSDGSWLDIGTGAGFPGMVVGLLRSHRTILSEPRRLRASFLSECIARLGVENTICLRNQAVEELNEPVAIISARAVAPVEKLLHAAAGCSTIGTRWLLPRGRSAVGELQELRNSWAGVFHVKQSVTDESAGILVLDQVVRR
ncbi:MAG: rRNA ((527)-N(7))-methyltransferase RsmG [Sphingomonas bacterium]|uniref:16S rRNA (guanine(527)-N(7))-methyltransferase RsmG n=1 Tax=Sphingomonas bacterium TaxID=1895847 RepID=UPI00262B7B58|nr:RsmG family class I SAM-dependent methyltransferase [Sphingomonas bacterium]MDB5696172.1 rRNA ((527)-N(7))-methyltransferase RsmG [Sphingomonas bacterium]